MKRPLVVILGAGRPFRGEDPSALSRTPGNRRVLDWILDALSEIPGPEICFVGGYRLEEVVRAYPDIHFAVNPAWDTSGSLGSLLAAPLGPRTTYVCYSDVVFSRALARKLADFEGEAAAVVDTAWRDRYEGRSAADRALAEKVRLRRGRVLEVGSGLDPELAEAEFTGLLKLSPRAMRRLLALPRQELLPGGLQELVTRLLREGVPVSALATRGEWAELNAPQDLARFVLGTKAETLERLRPLVRRCQVGELESFEVAEWRAGRARVLDRLRRRFGARRLVVRSSTRLEDSWEASQAGRFLSLLDVAPQDLEGAVERVIASYPDGSETHQVLVQEMLSQVALSGVALTRTLGHEGPYYTLNYDDTTRSTHTVTSGQGDSLRTVVVHRGLACLPEGLDPRLGVVLEAVRELEELVGHDALDVEFAVSHDGAVHVLQLRPLVCRHPARVSDTDFAVALQGAHRAFHQAQARSPWVLGANTLFGVMPDWNPAEIVGRRPGRLASSLYRYLITDEVWAAGRARWGYRDVRPQPLLRDFLGQPYVDVRASFNSFVPADLPEELAARLVEHYLARLRGQPHLHDKVEFDIAFTCWTFDFPEQSRRLVGFSPAERERLEASLLALTLSGPDRVAEDFARLELLERRFEALRSCCVPPLERAFLLLEDCRTYGTGPFASLARAGFVAVSLLRSLDRLLGEELAQPFLHSVTTVAGELERDGARVAAGELSWEGFVARYGHLRPGTYEVTSPAYHEHAEVYLRPLVRPLSRAQGGGWTPSQRQRLAERVDRLGWPGGLAGFETFLGDAVRGRESSKFQFTRNLSLALDDLAAWGRAQRLEREQLGHLALEDLLAVRSGRLFGDLAGLLRRRVEEGEEAHALTRMVELPPLLVRSQDLEAFEAFPTQPNFVTRRAAAGPVCDLSDSDGTRAEVDGHIVCTFRADPGFDWVMAHPLGGLITAYGGANSHLAIRAAELGVPAAIGVGEELFARLVAARRVELDCLNQRIRVVD